MSELEVFQFPATGAEVRTVVRDGEPWFVARDVCSVLGIANSRDAVSRLDGDGVGTADVIDSMGRSQQAHAVNESGLYELIFQSRRPEAKAFKRWVTHDVLPAIRKTGRYELSSLNEEAIVHIERQAQLTMRAVEIAKAEQAARELAERQVAALAPSAAAWDNLASGDGDWSVGDAAKILSRDPDITIGRDRLFARLEEWRWVFRAGDGRYRAMQSQVDCGRLSEIPQSHYHPRTGELVLDPPQVRIKPKGVAEIHRRLGGTAAPAIAATGSPSGLFELSPGSSQAA